MNSIITHCDAEKATRMHIAFVRKSSTAHHCSALIVTLATLLHLMNCRFIILL